MTLQKLFGYPITGAKPLGSGEPRWLTLARRYSGLREIKGKNHAPEILEMWRGLGLSYRDDEGRSGDGAADVFFFTATGGKDTIGDFERGIDLIDLRQLGIVSPISSSPAATSSRSTASIRPT